jgi:two-component system OmpR family response regulator
VAARILLVEDDPRIVSFLGRGLVADGYSVDVARDGEEGWRLARTGEFQLLLLDRVLPKLDGLELCRRLREDGATVPILMLTAKDALQDTIDGLKGGADDYLTKPFAFDELVARIEALLRRTGAHPATTALQVADLRLDLAAKTAWRGERKLALTPREFSLLAFLVENAGTVVSRARLLSNVWGLSFDPGTKIVNVYIRYLRSKIDAGEPRQLIRTVRGFGYIVSDDEETR